MGRGNFGCYSRCHRLFRANRLADILRWTYLEQAGQLAMALFDTERACAGFHRAAVGRLFTLAKGAITGLETTTNSPAIQNQPSAARTWGCDHWRLIVWPRIAIE